MAHFKVLLHSNIFTFVHYSFRKMTHLSLSSIEDVLTFSFSKSPKQANSVQTFEQCVFGARNWLHWFWTGFLKIMHTVKSVSFVPPKKKCSNLLEIN